MVRRSPNTLGVAPEVLSDQQLRVALYLTTAAGSYVHEMAQAKPPTIETRTRFMISVLAYAETIYETRTAATEHRIAAAALSLAYAEQHAGAQTNEFSINPIIWQRSKQMTAAAVQDRHKQRPYTPTNRGWLGVLDELEAGNLEIRQLFGRSTT